MTETLQIVITSKDGASKTFIAVADSAKKAGIEVEGAGKKGSAGLKQIDTQAKATEQSLNSVGDRAVAVGAAIGALAGFAAKAGVAHRDEARQVEVINRLYGEQAETMLEVAEATQDMTRYSNDAARESIILFGGLTQAYGLNAAQAEELVAVSADLAAAFNVDLADAATRVSAGLRGEAESLESVSIILNDTYLASQYAAQGLGEWTKVTDDATKAAFRYQELLKQTSVYQGLAADQAQGAGGFIRELANEFGDATQAIGGFLGPIGQVAAEMAPLAIALPVVGGGLGKFKASLAETGSGTALLSRGMAGLTAIANPLTLGLAALVGVGGAVVTVFNAQQRAAQEYQSTITNLALTLEMLRRQGDTTLADMGQDMGRTIDYLDDRMSDFGKDLGLWDYAIQEWEKSMGRAFNPGSDAINLEAYENAWTDLIDVSDEEMGRLNALLTEALSDPNIDSQAWIDWSQALLEGATSARELDEAIRLIETTPLSDFSRVATEGAASTGFLADMIDKTRQSVVSAAEAWNDYRGAQAAALQAFQEATQGWLENGDNILDWWLEYDQAINQGAASFSGTQEQYEQFLAAAQQDVEFRALVGFTDDLDDAGDALDRVLNIFGQIDSLGQRSSAASSIAEALVAPRGTWGEIDNMRESWLELAKTQDEVTAANERYNVVAEAGHQVQESNLRVQGLLNEVRADQMPLLAQEQASYEAYISTLSEMEPLEQRRALMLQDSAVQSKIASDYALAYSASIGEVPTEVATSVILQSAEANAGLMDLYLSMGLIEETWVDGEKVLKVNFPDATSVQDSVMMLTNSIDALTIAVGGVPPLRLTVEDEATPAIDQVMQGIGDVDGTSATVWAYGDGSGAIGVINDVTGELITLDSSSATVDINANDNASGPIGWVAAALANLNGSSATTYVETVYSGRVVGPTKEAHGGIAGYAMGGNVVQVWGAEAGYEVAHFAAGGMALLPTEGMYNVPGGTYIEPHNSARESSGGSRGGITIGPIIIQGSVTSEGDLLVKFAETMNEVLDQHDIRAGEVPA